MFKGFEKQICRPCVENDVTRYIEKEGKADLTIKPGGILRLKWVLGMCGPLRVGFPPVQSLS